MPFNNIPAELKQLPQWVVWKKFPAANGKTTKIPYNPRTGYQASVTDSATWGTFQEAIAAMHNVDGIGFVLTKGDPYTVIDLDYTEDTQQVETQIKISKAFNSYQEVSPSGKGLHVWVKGKVPSGRRRGSIEIYFSERYMTVTGQAFIKQDINEHNDRLNLLWAEMSAYANDVPEHVESLPQTFEDQEICNIAGSAVNGSKFTALYDGNWEQFYPSQSEADFALIDIIAYYTQNIDQVVRIFRASQLGKRPKAKRDPYVIGMVKRSFDRQPPQIDLETIQQNLEKELVELQQKAVAKPEPPPEPIVAYKYELPEGLVGDLIRFFYDASPLPVPEIAVATALGLMGGVCGRSYNISATGLNQYLLLLAVTGTGKDSIGKNIDKLMTEVYRTVPAAAEFVGPGEIASPQALIKYMDKTSKSFFTLAGEVSILFKQLCSPRANRHEMGLKRLLLQLYGASGRGNSFKPMIYSDAQNNTKSISSPAFSIVGEGTPDEFYELLSDDLIRSGFLPRFTIIEYNGKRPKMNKDHYKIKPSQQLVEQFGMICAYSLQLNNGNNVLDVKCNSGAQLLLDSFEQKCDKALNNAANETQRHLWNRAHLKVLRLAALLAIGVNYINPVVDEKQVMWAMKIIEEDVLNLLQRFDTGNVGAPAIQNEQHKEVKRAIVKYVASNWNEVKGYTGATAITWSAKVIPHSYITSYCRGKSAFKSDRLGPVNAVKQTITSMIECGEIAEVPAATKKEKGLGINGKVYAVVNMQQLKRI